MPIVFPHSSGFEIPEGEFVAAWQNWFRRFGPEEADWRAGAMPSLESDVPLFAKIEAGRHFSVDVLARMLTLRRYRDTRQISAAFFDANGEALVPCMARAPDGSRKSGARLHSAALAAWDRLPPDGQKELLQQAEALVEADLEVENDLGTAFPVDASLVEQVSEPIAEPDLRPIAAAERKEVLRALAEWINQEPCQARYRGQPVGGAVTGWPARLARYFWPNPETGYSETAEALAPLLEKAEQLARRLEEAGRWTDWEAGEVSELAAAVWKWSGVGRTQPMPLRIRKVFQSAMQGTEEKGAKLSGAWSALASFATAHLEQVPERNPQVFWNSRVASAVLWRLDRILAASGVSDPASLFPDLGTIPARGGTRPRKLKLRWPAAYGRWSGQFAGSQLVAEIRDILNSGEYPNMPLPNHDTGPWTVRGVAMVLFMDGY